MNSRPLLDYLAHGDGDADPAAMPPARAPEPEPNLVPSLEARLRELEARLRASEPAPAARPDLTLPSQIDAILKRRSVPQPSAMEQVAEPGRAATPSRAARMAVEPPPTAPHEAVAAAIDPEFLKFTEAVYLIGQAARRFIEEPRRAPVAAMQQAVPAAPSTGDIEALSAALRETVSAFRSVADDLAVSVGEIRALATREERAAPARPPTRSRVRHEDEEILELRETVADLQDRLDALLHARRRARY